MATKRTKTCDLCGCEQDENKAMATLTVPTEPDAKSKARKMADNAEQSGYVWFTFPGSGRAEMAYDVCLGCVTGLLRISVAEKRAIDPEVVQ